MGQSCYARHCEFCSFLNNKMPAVHFERINSRLLEICLAEAICFQ